jgi:hypothetical protein
LRAIADSEEQKPNSSKRNRVIWIANTGKTKIQILTKIELFKKKQSHLESPTAEEQNLEPFKNQTLQKEQSHLESPTFEEQN